MGDSGEESSVQAEVAPRETEEERLSNIKKDLEGWREVLIPLNQFLNWDKPFYPAIIVGFTTIIFSLIWYLEPSVLTTFSLLGLIFSGVDFVVPMVGPALFSGRQWTGHQEQQFEQICIRLCNARVHIQNFKETMSQLKVEKPKVYFIAVMGMLFVFAWIGYLIDNLCLTYLLVNFALLLPGLRRHTVFQDMLQKVKVFLDKTVLSKLKKN